MSRSSIYPLVVAFSMSVFQALRAADSQPQLVDIATVDPTIIIDLRYATDKNVTGHALYPRGTRALILPSVAQQLAGAQAWLASISRTGIAT